MLKSAASITLFAGAYHHKKVQSWGMGAYRFYQKLLYSDDISQEFYRMLRSATKACEDVLYFLMDCIRDERVPFYALLALFNVLIIQALLRLVFDVIPRISRAVGCLLLGVNPEKIKEIEEVQNAEDEGESKTEGEKEEPCESKPQEAKEEEGKSARGGAKADAEKEEERSASTALSAANPSGLEINNAPGSLAPLLLSDARH